MRPHTPSTATSKAITWFLLLPLFLLAGYGQLFFVNAYMNVADPGGKPDLVDTLSSSQWHSVVISATGLFLIILILAVTNYKAIVSGCAENKLFLALAVLCFASTAWSQFPGLTVKTAVVITSNIFFAIYLARRFTAEEQMEVLYLFGWIVVVMCPLVALLFPAIGIDHREGEAAWQGVFPHKNIAAIVMVYLLSVGLHRRQRTLLGYAITLVYVVACLFVIFMTKSRTGWALAAGLFVFAMSTGIVRRFRRSDRRLIIGAMCLLGALATAVLVTHIPQLLLLVGKDATMTGRIPLWTAVWHAIAKHPFVGYGYSAFWNGLNGESATVRISAGWGAAHAQSGFLDVWLGLGVIGVGLIITTVVVAIRNGLKCLVDGGDRAAQWYLAMVLITCVSNLDERSLMWPNCLEWVLFVLACVGLADRARRVRLEEQRAGDLERPSNHHDSGLTVLRV